MNAAIILGIDIEDVSPLLPYTVARRLGEKHIARKPGEPLLSDWGCGVRWALKGSRAPTDPADRGIGLAPDDAWPETEAMINAIPDLEALQLAERIAIKAYHRIDEDIANQVDAAGRRGVCPIVCMTVDQGWANIGREVWNGPTGEVLGGHATVCVAYSAILDAFCLDNWWGTDMGDDGYVWISRAAMDRLTYDVWCVEALAL